MNLEKKIGYLNSSRKNTQFQKKNQPKRSSGSKVMSILNSTVFQGFSEKAAIFCRNLLIYFLGFFHSKMYFTGKCDGPSIESFIKERKSAWEICGPIG
jgi:chemotaxis methyl-accepting protein methylase